MIYTIYIISSTGYPFYYKQVENIPKGVDLHLRFMDYSNLQNPNSNFAEGFELFAGLISALSEFSRLLGQELELLKFRSHKTNDETSEDGIRCIENACMSIEIPIDADALINCQNERWLNPVAIEAKTNLIFDKIVKHKLPLGPDKNIDEEEEKFIVDLLHDKAARNWLKPVDNDLGVAANLLIEKYGSYGLDSIIITSFEYTVLRYYQIEEKTIIGLLRNIGRLPDVKTYNWKHRMGFFENKQYNVYIINSGTGVTVNNVFMPYYYLLICEPESFLGEIPQKIYEKLNSIIDYE